MSFTDEQIRAIIRETVSKIMDDGEYRGMQRNWLCDDANDAVEAAKEAQKELAGMTLEKRGRLIAAMRKAALENAEYLAELAHNETGYGKVADKILKNKLAAEKTPGIEDLHAQAYTGDYGMTLVEGAPFGVIGR